MSHIHIGHGNLSQIAELLKSDTNRVAHLIWDRNLKRTADSIKTTLKKAGWQVSTYRVIGEERLKRIESLFPLYGKLLKNGADRQSLFIALGGGAVGDAVGFAASTYMRGVRWVNIPSTLLAQVDSSIGGKTAMNHPLGKNLIGSFHQPEWVICDIALLKTLPERDFISGLGEMIKYGIAIDARFFLFLKKNLNKVLSRDPSLLTQAIRRSIAMKCRMVERDEKDLRGVRKRLNFGHTIGHALEATADFKNLAHGHAVLYGMRVALDLSLRRRLLKPAAYHEMMALLERVPLPALPKRIKTESILKAIQWDKKKHAGKIKFLLIKDIGKTVAISDLSQHEIKISLSAVIRSMP